MDVVCLTDMGRVREINEDNCLQVNVNLNWHLLVVADGMGGHNAGEVASSIAVNSIVDGITQNAKEDMAEEEAIEVLKNAILAANRNIYAESLSDSSYSGMGTTITVAMVSNCKVLIGHVGDSRAYVLKEKKLIKITNDHSLVAELVKNGTITEDEAQRHPQKNIITRALGIDGNVDIDIENIDIDKQDIIFLCTDGLSNMLCDKDIEDVLINSSNIEDAAHKLVDKANELGGYDNITVVIAKAAYADGGVK